MFRIVIDGAGDLPEGWDNQYGIDVIPLRVNIGGATYTQGPGFTHDDFYRMVKETRTIPKTSLPSIGQVKEFYRGIAQADDTILSIHISSRLSGTFATVEAAARELNEEAGRLCVTAFDSGAGSVAQAFMAREARCMEQAGASLADILSRLESIRKEWLVIFTLDTLEYAYLNGRINRLQNALVSALQVKPIVLLQEGLLEMVDKVRTRQRSLERILEMVYERLGGRRANVAVVHAADPTTAHEMLQKARQILNINEGMVADAAIPVAANLGPKAIGIIAYPISNDT